MTTTQPLPTPGTERLREPAQGAAAEIATGKALVPSPPQPDQEQSMLLSPVLTRLPVELDVAVPVRDFRVRTLLQLTPGQIIESPWGNGEDVPLSAGDVQLAWSEFEVIDSQLAVRLTRLA